jgi:hypothetical protein
VWKERSNDLSVLLQRMRIPWIYRAFANTVNIRTTITHTATELTLKDVSRLGSHTLSFELNNQWAPVIQYGGGRHGQCLVTSDPVQQSVTVETVYFGPKVRRDEEDNEGEEQQHQPGSATGSRKGSDASEAQLTGDSSARPFVAPLALSDDEQAPQGQQRETLTRSDDYPRSQSVEHSPRAHALAAHNNNHGGAGSSAESNGRDRANSDPTARHMLLTPHVQPAEEVAAAAVVEEEANEQPPAGAASSAAAGFSTPARHALTPPHASSAAAGAGSALVLASPRLLPPSAGSLSITSRLHDVRQLVSPDLMRQVLTYSELDVVVCVCSRVYRREQPSAADKRKQDALDKKKRDDEAAQQQKKQQQPPPSGGGGAGGKQEDSLDRSFGSAGSSSGGGRQASGGATGGASAATTPVVATAASHPQPAPPVRVVLPSAAPPPTLVSSDDKLGASSSSSGAAASSNSGGLPPHKASSLSLASVTPARAATLFVLVAAVASGQRWLTLVVLVLVVSFFTHQHYQAQEMQQQLMRQQEQQQLFGAGWAGTPQPRMRASSSRDMSARRQQSVS